MATARLTDIWQKQHEKLLQWVRREEQARTFAENGVWYRPELNGWTGDLFDIGEDYRTGIGAAFNREECYELFRQIFKDTENMGSVGDLSLILSQGDLLAAMERAFRERHKTWPRSLAHATARVRGHGHEKGSLEKCIKQYLQMLEKTNANQSQ